MGNSVKRLVGELEIEDPDPPAGQSRYVRLRTITCNHCNNDIDVYPNSNEGWCYQCNHAICAKCAESSDPCRPFEAKLDALERDIERGLDRQRVLRSYGL